MDLPVMPPLVPMLAKPASTIPTTGGLSFEPKWDGFRCVIFRDGDDVVLSSRSGKPLTRYFPEVVAQVLELLPPRCVVDGELFLAANGRSEFDLLSERVHPAASRIQRLSVEHPASYVAFDLIALDEINCMALPFAERRAALVGILGHLGPSHPIHLAGTTTDPEVATRWLSEFEGAGFDGIVGKPLSSAYTPNVRTMIKIKHSRTADVVVAAIRAHKNSTAEAPLLGSLLLGLYDDQATLRHVGVSAAFTAKRRTELWSELIELAVPADEHPWGDSTAASRWSGGKDLGFIPLNPIRVAEVGYDHMEGDRFRHTTSFKRWRPDREPASCTYSQLEDPIPTTLEAVLEQTWAAGGAEGQNFTE